MVFIPVGGIHPHGGHACVERRAPAPSLFSCFCFLLPSDPPGHPLNERSKTLGPVDFTIFLDRFLPYRETTNKVDLPRFYSEEVVKCWVHVEPGGGGVPSISIARAAVKADSNWREVRSTSEFCIFLCGSVFLYLTAASGISASR